MGVKDFLDEYWRMIHLAAGWGALRAFLLVSVYRLRVLKPDTERRSDVDDEPIPHCLRSRTGIEVLRGEDGDAVLVSGGC